MRAQVEKKASLTMVFTIWKLVGKTNWRARSKFEKTVTKLIFLPTADEIAGSKYIYIYLSIYLYIYIYIYIYIYLYIYVYVYVYILYIERDTDIDIDIDIHI